MGTRKGSTVSMLKGRGTFLMKCEQPVSLKCLDELLGIPDPVTEVEAERAAELAAIRERNRLERVAQQEKAAQRQKLADVIGKEDSPNQG